MFDVKHILIQFRKICNCFSLSACPAISSISNWTYFDLTRFFGTWKKLRSGQMTISLCFSTTLHTTPPISHLAGWRHSVQLIQPQKLQQLTQLTEYPSNKSYLRRHEPMLTTLASCGVETSERKKSLDFSNFPT